MIKNIFLFIFSLFLASLLIIFGYLWLAPRNTKFLQPFFPKTLFSLENAPSNTLFGKTASASGEVFWQSRVATYATRINSPIKIQQGEEIDTYNNGKIFINFSSVGTISVFSDTQINFIQTLPANFVIEQKKGSVNYEKTGNVPMSVRGLDLLININSGKNTVFVDAKTAKIIVIVQTGSVTLTFNDTGNKTNILTVESGREYIFNNDTKIGTVNAL